MTNTQLYLSIGLPIIANVAILLLGFTLQTHHIDKRLDDLKEFWRSELLKHLEER